MQLLRKDSSRSYVHLIAFYILTLSFWTAFSTAQSQTNASLNRPDATAAAASNGDRTVTSTLTVGGATQTTTISGAGVAVAEPTSTDISPISFSTQRVPYLLNLPSKKVASQNTYPQWSGPTFSGCDDEDSIDYAAAPFRINVSAVYTQIDTNLQDGGRMNTFGSATYGNLRIVALGNVGNETHAFSGGLLSAAGVSSRFLTFPVFDNYTFLCDRIYPANNDTLNPNVNPASCQFGPGPVAFGVDIPLNSSYEAGTLWTQVRLLDHSNPARTLTCIEVQASPYNPDSWYWKLVLWLPVALFCAFFCLATIAAITTAETAQRMAYKNRAREGGPPTFVRDKLRPMILSALAGREMIRSPALLRFVTPGCWDILLHLQFLVALIMCHVQWPDFVYPFARQLAWSSLLGNVTIVEKERESHDILSTNTFLPEGDVGTQMQNSSSPLFMNSQQKNGLLNLGTSSTGMERFASAVGLQASSFFGTCLTIWLALVAVVIAVSLLAWLIDAFFEMKHRRTRRQEEASGEIVQTSPRQSISDIKANPRHQIDMSTHPLFGENESPSGRLGRAKIGHHSVALHGNLIRALVLFHLPITIVSTYQFAHSEDHSTVSIALSALSFAVFSVLTPIYLIRRIARTSTEKLYEDNNTLLALGPVYHMYAPGSQLFYGVSFVHSLALGIVVGVGQKSGSAQAIVIMVIEVIAALASSLWLPWGEGAMMGPLNFMTGVLRIVSAVLVLLLTSLVGFSNQARGWLTYVLLLIQAIFFAGATLVLFIKLVEAFVRSIWRVRFDERLSGRTAGLGGAIRKIKRRKLKHKKGALPLQLRKTGQNSRPQHPIRPSIHSRNTSMGSSSTMAMLDKAGPTSMTDNRWSYVEYLDHGQGKRPRSVASDLDYFGKMSPSGTGRMTPYSPIQSRHFEQDDTGSIMAAMPPLSASGDQRNNPAFVRVRGDRASDGNPYTPKTTSQPQAVQGRLPRPQSASGIYGEWANNQRRMPSNRPFPSPNHPINPSAQRANRISTHEMSSTQAAAYSARHSLAGLPQAGNGGLNNKVAKKGPFTGWRRKMNPNRRGAFDSDDSDDDWSEEEEGGTWNSRTAAQNRAPWMGAVKISAAIQSLFGGAHGGTATATLEGRAPVRTKEETESPQKGFEVVRKARPAQRTPVAQRLSDAASQKAETQNEQEQSLLPKHDMPMEREASDFYRDAQVTPPHLGQTTSNMAPSDFYESHLGILGADMQRAPSSAGHTINEPGEERFWLPPIDVSTDDGNKDTTQK
ncbi:hypothetical protein L7F22_043958 [Adiantum nelumboides]|nr:hypothetical protein [Adiantum nelumboides]